MSGPFSPTPRPLPTGVPPGGIPRYPRASRFEFLEACGLLLIPVGLFAALMIGGAVWDHFYPSPPRQSWEQTYAQRCKTRCTEAELRFVSVDLDGSGGCVCGAP